MQAVIELIASSQLTKVVVSPQAALALGDVPYRQARPSSVSGH
jgi:hypothetical protein